MFKDKSKMKKIYVIPEIELYQFQASSQLLEGSGFEGKGDYGDDVILGAQGYSDMGGDDDVDW